MNSINFLFASTTLLLAIAFSIQSLQYWQTYQADIRFILAHPEYDIDLPPAGWLSSRNLMDASSRLTMFFFAVSATFWLFYWFDGKYEIRIVGKEGL